MKLFFISSLFILLSHFTFAQEIQFTVKSGDMDYLNCPVYVELTSGMIDNSRNYRLHEITDKKSIEIPCQIEYGEKVFLWFIIQGEFSAGEERNYILKYSEDLTHTISMEVSVDHEKLELSERGSKILRYQVEELYPPEGIDPIYKRSAFIHPLWSPGGEILTNILHPQHLHHYGIWSPWTKTHIKGREIDYWNLGKGEGTVRFKSLPSTLSGSLYTGFTSVHEHVDFGGVGPDRVTMMETWNIKAWKLNESRSARIIDYHSQIYNNITDTIIFDAYRYGGGIAFRATAKWRKGTCTVLTSEGFTRNNADGERARWCIIEGVSSVKEGRSGILFISHPFNYDYPEALRVWPDDAEGGTGELMFDYCPARLNDWIIEPGKNYNLKYRMVVFDGKMSAKEAEKYYNSYCFPPNVEIITQSNLK